MNVLSSLGYLCTMQRGDGVGLSGTSHDRALDRDGVRHDPAPALAPAELILDDDLFSSSMRFKGALSNDGLREDDLAAGRWASASIHFSVIDWSAAASPDLLCNGELGALRVGNGEIDADLNLLPTRAMEQPCPQTSPECRAQLGDKHCRVTMRGRQRRAKIVGIEGAELLIDHEELGSFRFGRLRWLSGANCGIEQVVFDTDVGRISVREPPPGAVELGDRILLTEGCDGRLQTCADRFGNVANFRGEPHLPGTDFATRYPGG